jgi:hypothetical protein
MNNSSPSCFTDQTVDNIISAVPRILGFYPEGSLILLFSDGHIVGPCLRTDIPYGCDELDEWAEKLMSSLPEEVHGQLVFVMCFERNPTEDPEWYRAMALSLKPWFDRFDLESPEFWWVSGRREENDDARAASAPAAQLRLLEDLAADWTQERLDDLRDSLSGELGAERRDLLRQRHGPFPLEFGTTIRQLGLEIMSELVESPSRMGVVPSLQAVEALDLLLARSSCPGGVLHAVESNPGAARAVIRAMAHPTGVELLQRTALSGRRLTLDRLARRSDLGEQEMGRPIPESQQLNAELLDPVELPWEANAWIDRLPRPRWDDEAWEQRHSSVADEFFGAMLGFAEVCHWEDVHRFGELMQLLAAVLADALGERAEALRAWALWTAGRGSWACQYLASVRGEELIDPLAQLVHFLAESGVMSEAVLACPPGTAADGS